MPQVPPVPHQDGSLTLAVTHKFPRRGYNLNCWLMLFNREEEATVAALGHTTLATTRLKFLFLAAKIWRHAGRVGVSYSDHYPEQGLIERLMNRLQPLHRPRMASPP